MLYFHPMTYFVIGCVRLSTFLTRPTSQPSLLMASSLLCVQESIPALLRCFFRLLEESSILPGRGQTPAFPAGPLWPAPDPAGSPLQLRLPGLLSTGPADISHSSWPVSFVTFCSHSCPHRQLPHPAAGRPFKTRNQTPPSHAPPSAPAAPHFQDTLQPFPGSPGPWPPSCLSSVPVSHLPTAP